jgi:hypothetical protein
MGTVDSDIQRAWMHLLQLAELAIREYAASLGLASRLPTTAMGCAGWRRNKEFALISWLLTKGAAQLYPENKPMLLQYLVPTARLQVEASLTKLMKKAKESVLPTSIHDVDCIFKFQMLEDWWTKYKNAREENRNLLLLCYNGICSIKFQDWDDFQHKTTSDWSQIGDEAIQLFFSKDKCNQPAFQQGISVLQGDRTGDSPKPTSPEIHWLCEGQGLLKRLKDALIHPVWCPSAGIQPLQVLMYNSPYFYPSRMHLASLLQEQGEVVRNIAMETEPFPDLERRLSLGIPFEKATEIYQGYSRGFNLPSWILEELLMEDGTRQIFFPEVTRCYVDMGTLFAQIRNANLDWSQVPQHILHNSTMLLIVTDIFTANSFSIVVGSVPPSTQIAKWTQECEECGIELSATGKVVSFRSKTHYTFGVRIANIELSADRTRVSALPFLEADPALMRMGQQKYQMFNLMGNNLGMLPI